jgi:cystathionine beta-synthase
LTNLRFACREPKEYPRNAMKARIFENALQMIGNTPIVRLNRVTQGLAANFFAKVEFYNPGGSIKDRIGFVMIEDAEKKGLLKPGGTIVESTSGNTGVGLAIAAAIKGYKCVFVLPDKMSEEKIRNLRSFGAKVIVTPTAVEPDDPRSYYQVARRTAQEIPNAIYLNQYDNLSNREAHYQTTGPEVLEQFPDVDVIVAGIGTGGTICGIGKYIKEKKPSCQIVAVDPKGSIVFDYFKTGKFETRPKTYKIEGIGEDFIPKNYDFSVVDEMVQVEDKESFLMTRDLLTKEGLYVGVSCGSAVCGAIRYAQQQKDQLKGKNVLIILPDSGNRYTSKVFNDDWMREAGFLDRPSLGAVADILHLSKVAKGAQNSGKTAVIMAKQTDKVSAVIELMRDKNISQLPVTDEAGWVKGIISEGAILSALYETRCKASDSIVNLVDASVEFVTPSDPVEKVSRLVSAGKTPLVTDPNDGGKFVAILTKIDLLSYLGSRV